MLVLATLVSLLGEAPARADVALCSRSCRVDEARALLERGDNVGARAALRAAYELEPVPELLFALGQVELKLGNYAAAIGYYERFIAAAPAEDQVALAQQAIGAARMQIARPTETKVVARTLEHRWRLENTGLVVLGGAAIAVGVGVLYSAQQLADDRSGTLSAYDDRLDRARTIRLTGAGLGVAGALAIGAALVRWRLDTVEVSAAPVTGGAAVTLGRRW